MESYTVRWQVGANIYSESFTVCKAAQDFYDSKVRRGFQVISKRPI